MNSDTTTISPMNSARVLGAYVTEAKYALLRFLRTPAFIIPTLLFPVLFYFLIGYLFGAFNAKNDAINVPLYVFCGFAAMTAMTPGMFGFGIGLAMERDQGLFTLKRALPMPPMASLIGSICMSMLCTLLASVILAGAALFAGVISLGLDHVAAVIAIATVGAIPFCALGLLLGSFTSGRAAPAVVNIFYIVLIYFSGLFVPLPKAIDFVVMGSPAFYLHQLALSAAGVKTRMVGGAIVHVIVLLGVTLLALAISARRLARTG